MARQDDYTRYTIRIPTPLYERVKAAAGDRSVNAEIIEALEEKFPTPLVFPKTMGELFALLEGTIALMESGAVEPDFDNPMDLEVFRQARDRLSPVARKDPSRPLPPASHDQSRSGDED